MNPRTFSLAFTIFITVVAAKATDQGAAAERMFDAPHGMKISVKMIGPYSQETDLQVICAFKHKQGGDTYLSAMKDFNDKVGGLLSSLRDRGEFVGDLGETILFTPPAGSITPKRILVIGLGDEANLSLNTLGIVGRIAAREAVRLGAKNVSWAPVIRDQGNTAIDVGDGDSAFVEAMIGAYDTELRLQSQKLSEPFSIEKWTIEAGPTYFDSATAKVDAGIKAATSAISSRSNDSFSTIK